MATLMKLANTGEQKGQVIAINSVDLSSCGTQVFRREGYGGEFGSYALLHAEWRHVSLYADADGMSGVYAYWAVGNRFDTNIYRVFHKDLDSSEKEALARRWERTYSATHQDVNPV